MKVTMRDAFGNVFDVPTKSHRVHAKPCDDGITEQSHKDSCDINRIMSNYIKTGTVPVPVSRILQYGDFSEVTDYKSALDLVLHTQEIFQELPADVRAEFNHDPQQFINAHYDPEQRERLIKCGAIIDDSPAPTAPVLDPPAEQVA